MPSLGLVVRPSLIPSVVPLLEKIESWAAKNGFSVVYEEKGAVALGGPRRAVPAAELVKEADPVITLGGDGTLIGVGRFAHQQGPRFIGVNFGRLGFLTEVIPEELINTLDDLVQKRLRFDSRNLLLATVRRGQDVVFTSQAVNDVVFQKSSRDKIISLTVTAKKEKGIEKVVEVVGDGVIFATPTGSTAYSLSAGGAIVHPALSAVIITPVCPHSLGIRPLVLPSYMPLAVSVPPYDGQLFLTIDGQLSFELKRGDQVVVESSQNVVRFVRTPAQGYFEILRAKLNWNVANGQSEKG